MEKMMTLKLAIENKAEIMQYVLYDSKAILEIHKKFKKSIRRILVDYCMEEESF